MQKPVFLLQSYVRNPQKPPQAPRIKGQPQLRFVCRAMWFFVAWAKYSPVAAAVSISEEIAYVDGGYYIAMSCPIYTQVDWFRTFRQQLPQIHLLSTTSSSSVWHAWVYSPTRGLYLLRHPQIFKRTESIGDLFLFEKPQKTVN